MTLTAEDFINHITGPLRQDLDTLARAEAARLSGYFSALERRLAPVENLSQKGSLTRLFTKVAADTRNLILSEFTLIPSDYTALPAFKNLEDKGMVRSYFKSVFRRPNDPTRMGFIQAIGIGDTGTVTLPVLTLDSALLKKLEGFDVQPVLNALQAIVTIGNHDMLHHLTNTYLNNDVAQPARTPPYTEPLREFMSSRLYGGDSEPESYESWAILSHAATWNEARQDGAEDALQQASNACFTAIAALDRTLEQSGAPLPLRVKTADYFSKLACHGLIRICPLHSQVMEQAVAHSAALCLDPDQAYADFVHQQTQFRLASLSPEIRGEMLRVFSRHLEKPDTALARDRHDMTLLLAHYCEVAMRCDWDMPDNTDIAPLYFQPEEHKENLAAGLRILSKTFRNGSTVTADLPPGLLADVTELEESIIARMARIFCEDRDLRTANRALIHDAANQIAPHLHGRVQAMISETEKSGKPPKKRGLFLETLANYARQGQTFLPGKDGKIALTQLKTLELLATSPEIVYLLSPGEHNDRLHTLQNRTGEIDRGIFTILTH